MKLIIAEKPSVAKSIASALGAASRADGFYEGNGLLVSWCLGHLVAPMDAGNYDDRFRKWRFEDLPILPELFRYEVLPDKREAFQNLKQLMDRPDVHSIVNACDAGREGELIFRLVIEQTGCRKPVERLWISSMEDEAIREGFRNLRSGTEFDPLYQSALCRQKADWLVGINATRLFSVLYHRTLNVGRVQTPTLAMLTERAEKIRNFKKEPYYHVRLTLPGAEAVSEKILHHDNSKRGFGKIRGAGKCFAKSTMRHLTASNPASMMEATFAFLVCHRRSACGRTNAMLWPGCFMVETACWPIVSVQAKRLKL